MLRPKQPIERLTHHISKPTKKLLPKSTNTKVQHHKAQKLILDENFDPNTRLTTTQIDLQKKIFVYQHKNQSQIKNPSINQPPLIRYSSLTFMPSKTVYTDDFLGFGKWVNHHIPQKLDNDADSDDEQISKGVKKLYNQLKEAAMALSIQ